MTNGSFGTDHIGDRVAEGDRLLEAAKGAATGAVKKKLDGFVKAHGAYVKAAKRVADLEETWRASQQVVADADLTQDADVGKLATALAGDGLPRTNPFKAFGAKAPSVVATMGYAAEATAVRALVSAVNARKGMSAGTYAAARAAEASAKKVEAAIARSSTAHAAYGKALVARDVLAQPWETAFAALKRGVRAAEDDGAKGLYARLFEAGKKAPAHRGAKKGGSGSGATGATAVGGQKG